MMWSSVLYLYPTQMHLFFFSKLSLQPVGQTHGPGTGKSTILETPEWDFRQCLRSPKPLRCTNSN